MREETCHNKGKVAKHVTTENRTSNKQTATPTRTNLSRDFIAGPLGVREDDTRRSSVCSSSISRRCLRDSAMNSTRCVTFALILPCLRSARIQQQREGQLRFSGQ